MPFTKKLEWEEEKKNKKIDYKELIKQKRVYIIENRHLKLAEEDISENLQDARHYRLECGGMYVFDFDRYLAQPQMKDILAKMGMYLEVKMLYWVIALLVISLLFLFMFFVRLPSKGYIDEVIQKINIPQAIQAPWNIPQPNQTRTLQDLIP